MDILLLPEEILVIICKYLDGVDKWNIYNTCTKFRQVSCIHSASKHCKFLSLTVPGNTILKSAYLKEISPYIEKFDMSGVPNLNKINLITCLNRMKNLRTLNIAYTSINILDIVDKRLNCKNINNITINFDFNIDLMILGDRSSLIALQDVFQHFEYVHFVGEVLQLLYSRLPMHVLKKSNNLVSLKFTILRHTHDFHDPIANLENVNNMVKNNFSVEFHLRYHFPSCDVLAVRNSIIHMLDFDKLEYIIVVDKCYPSNVYISKGLAPFVTDHFGVKSKCVKELTHAYYNKNSLLLFWNKENVKLDNIFFDCLLLEIKDFFPNHINGNIEHEPLVANNYTSCYIIQPVIRQTGVTRNKHLLKQERVAPSGHILTFDSVLANNKTVTLLIDSANQILPGIVTLAPTDSLKRITTVSISVTYKLSNDFFPLLFKYCTNLITLNVDRNQNTFINLYNSINLCQKLQNLKMTDSTFNFNLLFISLSSCDTLKNVHIVDVSSYPNTIKEIDLLPIFQGNSLYTIYIAAKFSESIRKRIVRYTRRLTKKYCKKYMNIQICTDLLPCSHFSYDPFIAVFPD